MSPGWPCLLSLICLVLSGLGDDIQAGGADFMSESNMLPQEGNPPAIPEEKTGTPAATTAQTQCQRPAGEGIKPATEKEFYDKDGFINMTCETGYRPSSSPRIQCINPGTDNEWSPRPQCIAQCKQPEDTDLYKIYGYKDSYNVGDYVVVECRPGYRTADYYITCVGPDRWRPSPGCIERCKKPSISNLKRVYMDQDYYRVYEEIMIVCDPGYYPLNYRMQCRINGSRDDWRPSAVCIEVKGTIMEVTSTSIRLSIVCTPDLCQNTTFSYISSCIHHRGDNIGCSNEKDVTFSDLKPNTQYEILISRRSGRFSLPLQAVNITTPESVPTDENNLQDF